MPTLFFGTCTICSAPIILPLFYHFIVKSHVLFVLHPSFLFIGKLYYSYNPHDFHLYFFYLLNTYLFFAKLHYSLYTPLFFQQMYYLYKTPDFHWTLFWHMYYTYKTHDFESKNCQLVLFTLYSFSLSFNRCTICTIFMIFMKIYKDL